jgi:N-acetylmuramoyl-L-alanine amidase
VSAIRSWSGGDYTRVAVYLTRDVSFEKTEVPAAGGRPRRLLLDLGPALLEERVGTDGAVGARRERGERFQAVQRDAATVRVTIDLPGEGAYQLFRLEDPPRFIVDVGTEEAREAAGMVAAGEGDAADASRAAPTAPATPKAVPRSPPTSDPVGELLARRSRREDGPPPPPSLRSAPRPSGSLRRIVVDAGHGGHDTGAIGPSRLREKDVTLAMARLVAKRLRAAGFEVVLTRDRDVYLALEERTALANTAGGDLFVSLHANAHPRRDRSGIETFYLDVTSDRYARRLAARENGLFVPGDSDGEARRILADLDAKRSAVASRRLAQLVQRELCDTVRSRVGEVRDIGVKSALFYVLLGARMPAVLVETAFVSNLVEEKRLASGRYQEVVADAVSRAVARFATEGARVAAAQ